MRYVVASTAVLAFMLAYSLNRKSKSPSPSGALWVAYGIAISLNAWYAFKLPIPSVGEWISSFSRPIADLAGKWLS